jgi:hypothetical protein
MRFEKLKKMDFIWFVDTLNASFPEVENKLQLLSDVARNLQASGSVGDAVELSRNEEEQWKTNGLSDLPTRQPSRPQASAPPRRSLGMRGMRY